MNTIKLQRKRLTPLSQHGFDHALVALAAFVLVGVVGTAMVVQSHAYSTVWKGYLEEGSATSGYCLSDNGTSNGSKVVLNACKNGSTTQVWDRNDIRTATVMGVQNVEEFTLQSSAGSTKCLNNPYGSKTNGTALQLYTCSSTSTAGLWVWGGSLTGKGLTSRQIVNVASGLCVDDSYGTHTANNKVQVWSCKKTAQTNQSWYEVASVSSTGGGGSSGGGTTSTSGGCKSGSTVAPCIGSATTGASGWGAPKFDDEFTGSSLNTTYWNTTWFNGGTMNNVSTSASNESVSGGSLNLTLSSSGTGALVNTNPSGGSASKGFTFGTNAYVEARMYFPGNGSGIYNWPAFWTDGQSWPTDGESDIAEILGGNMTSNYHSPQGSNNGPDEGTSWANGWHTYALDRENGTDVIYYDGKQVRNYSSDDGGAPQYIIFNIGCSGSCTTGSASTVKADYVRVWEK